LGKGSKKKRKKTIKLLAMQVEINDYIEKIIISSEAVLVFYKDKVLKNYKKYNKKIKNIYFYLKQ